MIEIEKKALALVNEIAAKRGTSWLCIDRENDSRWEALCRALERHEAFAQEVSDAMLLLQKHLTGSGWGRGDRINLLEIPGSGSVNFDRFILPPVDPLVEAIKACGFTTVNSFEPEFAACLRTALAARGGKIVWDGE